MHSEAEISRRLKEVRQIVIVADARCADAARVQVILDELTNAAAVENRVKNRRFARAGRAAALRQRR